MSNQLAHGQRVEVRSEHTGISDRASTRVHAAPGGNSQLNLFGGGGDAAPQATPRTVASNHDMGGRAHGARIEQRTEHTGISDRASTRVHAAPGGNSQLNLFGGGGDAAPQATPRTVASNHDMGGRAHGARIEQHTGISDRASTRVHAAPGGNSQLNIFGGGADTGALTGPSHWLGWFRSKADFIYIPSH